MGIETQRDPRTKKEITFVSGKLEKIYVNPVKEVKTYAGPKGPWTPTHTINFIVDGVRIGLGLTDKTALRGKDEEDKYHDLTEGSEVTVEISEIGEYNGKPTYNTKPSLIFINKLAAASAAPVPAASGGYSGGSKDKSGVEIGHALNGAMRFLGGKAKPEEIIEAAKRVHTITDTLKKEYRAANPKMSEYDSGAAVGHAVLNSLELAVARKKTLDDVEGIARKWLAEVVPAVADFVKNGNKPEAPTPAERPVNEAGAADVDDIPDDSDLPF